MTENSNITTINEDDTQSDAARPCAAHTALPSATVTHVARLAAPSTPKLIGAATVAGLALAATLASPTMAPADESLESLQNEAIQANERLEEARQELDDLNEGIARNEERSQELAEQIPEHRERAKVSIREDYKLRQNSAGLLDLVLSSASAEELVSSVQYLEAIVESNTEAIATYSAEAQELDATTESLRAQKDMVTTKTEEAETALADAQEAVQAAKSKATENAAASQQLYESGAISDPVVSTGASGSTTASGSMTTGASGAQSTSAGATAANGTSASDASASKDAADSTSASTEKTEQSASAATTADNSGGNGSNATADATSDNGSSQTDEATDDAGTTDEDTSYTESEGSGDFTYVGASTYGEGDGFMYGTTASGDIVTPGSMGVAMKEMPLGTVIEIEYNGTTVTAVVNDRGPYVTGREIDLQPAVAHALGFDGVDTVGYRVVG